MPPTYSGFDVLEDEPDHSEIFRADQVTQRIEIVESPVGARRPVSIADFPRYARTLRFHLLTPTDHAWLQGFWDARRGRLAPFWLPSYEHDVELATGLSTGTAAMTIRKIGYAANIFPLGPPRRHFYIYDRPTGTALTKKILAAVDNGNGTETLTFNGNPPISGFPTIVCQLRLCRLDADEMNVVWRERGYASCDFPVIEVPKETPA